MFDITSTDEPRHLILDHPSRDPDQLASPLGRAELGHPVCVKRIFQNELRTERTGFVDRTDSCQTKKQQHLGHVATNNVLCLHVNMIPSSRHFQTFTLPPCELSTPFHQSTIQVRKSLHSSVSGATAHAREWVMGTKKRPLPRDLGRVGDVFVPPPHARLSHTGATTSLKGCGRRESNKIPNSTRAPCLGWLMDTPGPLTSKEL